MRKLLLLGAVAFYAASFDSTANASPTAVERLPAFTDGYPNSFAYKLIPDTVKDRSGNFIFSPIGITLLLSQIASGARGRTNGILSSALRLPDCRISAPVERQRLVDYLCNSIGANLKLSNGLFYDVNRHPKLQFTSSMTECASGDVVRSQPRHVDFKDRNEASRLINAWIDERTHVKDLIRPTDIARNMDLVLVNTASFESNWLNSFNAALTEPRIFHVDAERYMNVPTMYGYDYYNHGSFDDIDAKFIELPYKKSYNGDETRLLIVLPNKIDGLPHVKKNLVRAITSAKTFQNVKHPIHLHLPKFKIESAIDAEIPLRKLNLGNIFDNSADFGHSSMKVDRFVQMTSITVNEGPQKINPNVIASRSLEMRRQSGHHFAVDRPFCVAIISKSRVPLFVGIVTDPLGVFVDERISAPAYRNVPEVSEELIRDEKPVHRGQHDDSPRPMYRSRPVPEVPRLYSGQLPVPANPEYHSYRPSLDSHPANQYRKFNSPEREYESRFARSDLPAPALATSVRSEPEQYPLKPKDGSRVYIKDEHRPFPVEVSARSHPEEYSLKTKDGRRSYTDDHRAFAVEASPRSHPEEYSVKTKDGPRPFTDDRRGFAVEAAPRSHPDEYSLKTKDGPRPFTDDHRGFAVAASPRSQSEQYSSKTRDGSRPYTDDHRGFAVEAAPRSHPEQYSSNTKDGSRPYKDDHRDSVHEVSASHPKRYALARTFGSRSSGVQPGPVAHQPASVRDHQRYPSQPEHPHSRRTVIVSPFLGG